MERIVIGADFTFDTVPGAPERKVTVAKVQPRRAPVRDDVIDTVIAEAGGEGRDGMQAVANVIKNRSARRGQSPEQVVSAPHQFEGYGKTVDPNQRAEAAAIVNGVFSDELPDITGGADHFHADSVNPDWAGKLPKTKRIGGHTFYTSGDPEQQLGIDPQRTASTPAPKKAGKLNVGDSSSPQWQRENLVTIEPVKGQRWQVYKPAAKAFEGLIKDLEAQGYPVSSSGGFNYRNIRGSNKLSEHAKGLAIDINAASNPMLKGKLKTDLPANIRELAAKHGLKWGGDFKKRPDPMHFEYIGGGDVDPMTTAGTGRSESGLERIVIDENYKSEDTMGDIPGVPNFDPAANYRQRVPETTQSTPEDPFARLNAERVAAGKTPLVAMPASKYEKWREKWEAEQPGLISDVGNWLIKGWTGTAQGARELLNQVPLVGPSVVGGIDAIDEWMHSGDETSEQILDAKLQEAHKALSAKSRAAGDKNWISETENEDGSTSYGFGPAWSDPRAYLGGAVESIPATVLTMVPGGILARSRYLGALASGATPKVASALAARTAMLAGAVSEGLLGGGMNAAQTRAELEKLPQETFQQSEAFQALVNGGMTPEDARQAIINDASTQSFLIGGLADAAFGGVGDRVLAKIIADGVGGGVVKRMVRGAARAIPAEAGEEAAQSAGEQFGQNVAVQPVIDRPLTEGVGEAAVGGAVAGGVMGGALGAPAGAFSREGTPPPPPPANAPPGAQGLAAGVGAGPKGPLQRAIEHGEGELQRTTQADAKKSQARTPPGAPPIGSTVTVKTSGAPFRATVNDYDAAGNANVLDPETGEVLEVPVANLVPDAKAIDLVPQRDEKGDIIYAPAPGDVPAPTELDPTEATPAEPKAGETTSTLPPKDAQKPALDRFPGPPPIGQSVIVDAPGIPRRGARVESYEGDDALVRFADGSTDQIPLEHLYVDKRTKAEIEAEEAPPIEREKAQGPRTRQVLTPKGEPRAIEFPDDLHTRLYDLGLKRMQAKKLGGASHLDLDKTSEAEQQKIADELRISLADAGLFADDYRYRAQRHAGTARSDLPQKMYPTPEKRLKRAQSEYAEAKKAAAAADTEAGVPPAADVEVGAAVEPTGPAAAPTDNEEWWDKNLTPEGRRRVLERANIKRPRQTLWKNFPINLQSKLVAVRPAMDAEFEREAAPRTDMDPAGPGEVTLARFLSGEPGMERNFEIVQAENGPVFALVKRADTAILALARFVETSGVQWDHSHRGDAPAPVRQARKLASQVAGSAARLLGQQAAVIRDYKRADPASRDGTMQDLRDLLGEADTFLAAAAPPAETAKQPDHWDPDLPRFVANRAVMDNFKKGDEVEYTADKNDSEEIGTVITGTVTKRDTKLGTIVIAANDRWGGPKTLYIDATRVRHRSPVDVAAHQAATSPENDKPDPTEGQIDAGNYEKGHVRYGGMEFSIENPEGSVRSSRPGQKPEWSSKIEYAHYGQILGTKGADGELVDVFLKPGTELDEVDDSTPVWVIDQKDAEGFFDEHKVMAGYDSEADAREAYLANYPKGWSRLGAISETDIGSLKTFLGIGFKAPEGAVIGPSDMPFSADEDGNPPKGMKLKQDEDEADRAPPIPSEPENVYPYGDGPIFPAPKGAPIDPAPQGTKLISQAEADARIAVWKDIAKEIGKTDKNEDKIIVSLFDASGVWSKPFLDAGYSVFVFDAAHGDDIFNDSPGAVIDALKTQFPNGKVVGILSACPCTTFAASGSQWWEQRHDVPDDEMVEKMFGRPASKIFATPVEANTWMVHMSALYVDLMKPQFHVLENPIGRIGEMSGLPKPLMRFDPADFGDPYTKRTQLWGDFNTDLPIAPVEPTEGSKIHKLSSKQKAERSETPEGFAYSFFIANDPDAAAMWKAATETPKRTIPRETSVEPPHPSYRDLGIDNLALADPKGEAAKEETLRRGRASRREQLIILDVNGDVIANGEGTPDSAGLTNRTWKIAIDPGEQLVAHHNHPLSSPPSVADTAMAALPGMHASYVHANDGSHSYRTAMRPAARRHLLGQPYIAKRLANGEGIVTQVSAIIRGPVLNFQRDLQNAANNKQVDVDELNGESNHMINMALRDAGWVDYDAGGRPDSPLLANPAIKPIYDRLVAAYAKAIAADSDADNRRAVSVRHPGELARFSGQGESDAAKPGAEPGADARPAVPAPEPAPQADEVAPAGRTQIGVNADGDPVFEDQRGVRSYVRDGIRHTEKVRLDPRGAISISVEDRPAEYQTVATPAAPGVSSPSATEATNGKPEELGSTGASALEGVPTEPVPAAGAGGDAGQGPVGSSASDISGVRRPAEPGVQGPGGVGNGEGTLPDPTGGSAAAVDGDAGQPGGAGEPTVPRDDEGGGPGPEGVPEPSETVDLPNDAPVIQAQDLPVDYTITDADDLGEGGAKTKFRNNVAAIRVIRTLEAENRSAVRKEQTILAKWVGWGGLKQAFPREDGSTVKGWEKEAAELKELLTPDEYKAASASTLNAHYTSAEVVTAMWDIVSRLGFVQGHVLEPSVGAGNFLGLMPAGQKKASYITGVELDHLTGAIARNLYPQANIQAPVGFEQFEVPDDHFDLVIGNPPFGSERLYDALKPKLRKFSIHNFFFAKSIDGLKPNGIAAMVVSNYLLDQGNDSARRYIADQADLVAAIRLPNDAFMKNAGTQVTTDIIILRKRREGEAPGDQSWLRVGTYTGKDGKPVPLNRYFIDNPDMMLGDFGAYGTMYAAESSALISREGADLAADLEKAIQSLPRDIMDPPGEVARPEVVTVPSTVQDAVVGSMFLAPDGTVHIRKPNSLGHAQSEAVEFASDKEAERVAGMVRIRDVFAKLRRAQISPDADQDLLDNLRGQLNKFYDAFVKKHSFINAQPNRLAFSDDPTWPQISALEANYDKGISPTVSKTTGEAVRAPSATKTAIFTQRTQQPYAPPKSASSAKDALTQSLNELGRVDIGYMARQYGKTEDDIVAELGSLLYKAPAGDYQTADDYLSGNVKQKLAEALKAAKQDRVFERNVDALKLVQPPDVAAIDITVQPGAPWVPSKHVANFVDTIADSKGGKAYYAAATVNWIVTPAYVGPAAQLKWGTNRAGVDEVLSAAMNAKRIIVSDRQRDGTYVFNQAATDAANQKVDQVKDEWARWVWRDDDRRVELARIYNDTYNTTVERKNDGSHLTLPGKSSVINLRPHQSDVVWRAITSPTVLFDHQVGAGKTFAGVASIMEWRRIGLAKKPMVVVPNHLVGQWAADFLKLYPGANILAATKKDFDKENRKRLFARVATGDWDAVIVAHSSFGRIGVSLEFHEKFINEQLADLEASIRELRAATGQKSRNVRRLEQAKAKLEAKLRKLLDAGNKDVGMTFEEMGIDGLLVDEAHEFKNLAFATSIEGLNAEGSKKASDLYMKIRSIMERTGGRNIIFATGTPVSNSMAEMYTMQRYLDPAALKAQGLAHFDAWARVFGQVVTDWEVSATGRYKLKSRFAKFSNAAELIQRYRDFADVITNDDIVKMVEASGGRFDIPKVKGGAPVINIAPLSPQQSRYIGEPLKDGTYPKGTLIWRSENLPKKRTPEPGDDNMLAIMGDARKAALDMRLIDPAMPDFASSKVNKAADNIKRIYDEWHADKGTQLVFIDLSTPGKQLSKEQDRIRAIVQRLEDAEDAKARAEKRGQTDTEKLDAEIEAAQIDVDKLTEDELLLLNQKGQFSVYDDLKQKLIARGIPADEIAFIHDANTDMQKQALFGKVRAGTVRVMFGSTPKMGAGTNVQNRIVALHHLDAPWRPSDLEQRDGRGIRQGNELYARDPDGFALEIHRYATEKSLDAMLWQAIERKAKFIQQIRKGDRGAREFEDVGGEVVNAAAMKAASSGNPLVLEEMDLRGKVRKLENQRNEHLRVQHEVKNNLRYALQDIERIDARLPNEEIESKTASDLMKQDFSAAISGKTYTKVGGFGGAIIEAGRKLVADKVGQQQIGKWGPYKIEGDTTDHFSALSVTLKAPDANHHDLHVGIRSLATAEEATSIEGKLDVPDPVGVGQRVRNAVANLIDQPDLSRARRAAIVEQIPKLEAQIGDWDGQAEYDATVARHRQVLQELRTGVRVEEKKVVKKRPPFVSDTKKAQAFGAQQLRRKKEAAKRQARLERVREEPVTVSRERNPGENRFIAAIKSGLSRLTPHALGAVYLNYFPELAQANMRSVGLYLRIKRAMDAYRGKKHAAMDDIAQEWAKYVRNGRAKAEELADLMHDATIAGVDPDSLDEAVIAQPGYADLRARFLAMAPIGQEIYRKVRDAYAANADELDQILQTNFRKAQAYQQRRADRALAKALLKIRSNPNITTAVKELQEREANEKHAGMADRGRWAANARITRLTIMLSSNRVPAPYFPLGRFGKYFVAVRDDEGDLVAFSLRETQKARNDLAKEYRAQHPGAKIESGLLDDIDPMSEGVVKPSFMADIEKMLNDISDDAQVNKQFMDQIWQRYLRSLPELSVRKRAIHRSKVPGFDRDALRVFGNHMFHSAHQMARLKYGLELGDALEEAKVEATEAPDRDKGTMLTNELSARHKFVMNPQGSAVAQWASSAAFTYYLAASPAAALVNTLQTPMVGIPMLAARFASGYGRATSELLKASRNVFGNNGLSEAETGAMEKFEELGLIDRTQSHDIAGVGETGVEYSPLRQRVMAAMSLMFHKAEVGNRRVTALAAYRMARQKGLPHDRAIDAAADLTWRTHFDYSNSSRPRLAQGDIARIALALRSYQMNMLYRLGRDLHQMLKGATPAARKEARTQFAGMIAMQALLAGATGVAGYNTAFFLYGIAATIAAAITGSDGEDPFEAEERFRQSVLDLLGPQLGGMVLNGTPGHYLGIDLTSRIGMPDLWFRSPNKDFESGRDAYFYTLEQFGGAPLSVLKQIYDGFDALSSGDGLKAFQRVAPKVLKDLTKAGEYAWQGVTNWNGETVISPENISYWELIAQASGFTPAHIAEKWDQNSSLKNAERRVKAQRQGAINSYAMAQKIGDTEGMKDALAEIRRFNQSPAGRFLPITGQTLQRSLKQRAVLERKRQRGDGVLIQNEGLGEYLREQLPDDVYQ